MMVNVILSIGPFHRTQQGGSGGTLFSRGLGVEGRSNGEVMKSGQILACVSL
jgi:hypothetical protein